MYNKSLFLVLLTNHSSFIRIEWLKKETDIRKSIIYIRKKNTRL